MCGENFLLFCGVGYICGSSPRVRGKRFAVSLPWGCVGLIPACAGKTIDQMPKSCRCWAHPRVCGENLFIGSSPLTILRLIPACAGKTSGEAGDEKGSTAHPRVCGENSCQRAAPLQRWGSSPRVRGKREECAGEAEGRGLIPACAGKTLRHRVRGRMRRAHPRVCGENMFRLGTGPTWGAHPRVCGENTSIDKFIPQRLGSSPRVRGKLRWC